MRILTISDKIEPVLYGAHIRERVGAVDLILACGDLPRYYLEYVVGMLDAPLYFVFGNHDRAPDPPLSFELLGAPNSLSWGVNLHLRTVNHRGLLLAGLEGCRAYNPGRPFQYSEREVGWQVFRLMQKLRLNRLRYGRYLDVLITHAPPRGIHDAEDLPHQGFVSYLKLLRACRPALMVHGHTHIYNHHQVTQTDFEGTQIINTYGYRLLELSPRDGGRTWEVVRADSRH